MRWHSSQWRDYILTKLHFCSFLVTLLLTGSVDHSKCPRHALCVYEKVYGMQMLKILWHLSGFSNFVSSQIPKTSLYPSPLLFFPWLTATLISFTFTKLFCILLVGVSNRQTQLYSNLIKRIWFLVLDSWKQNNPTQFPSMSIIHQKVCYENAVGKRRYYNTSIRYTVCFWEQSYSKHQGLPVVTILSLNG